MIRWCPPLPSDMNSVRSAIDTSESRRPSTSQRRKPPRTMAKTMARSRWVRRAPINASTSAGERILGNERGTRTSGTVVDGHPVAEWRAPGAPGWSAPQYHPERSGSSRSPRPTTNVVRWCGPTILIRHRSCAPRADRHVGGPKSRRRRCDHLCGVLVDDAEERLRSKATARKVFGRLGLRRTQIRSTSGCPRQ